jgi:hypothetical protein
MNRNIQRNFLWTTLLVSTFMLSACGSRFNQTDVPQLAVSADKFDPVPEWNSDANQFDYYQHTLPAGMVVNQSQDSSRITLSNIGQKELVIEDIYIEADGNPYIQILWSAGKPDFPKTLAPNNSFDVVEFQVLYEPKEPESFVDGVLTIVSNDLDHPDYQIRFSPPGQAGDIQVSPPSYTYLNATNAKPETQLFTVTNQGSEALVFYKASLMAPNPEFDVINTPAPGITIQPGGQSVTFEVRYKPLDSVQPDNTTIIVETNDPYEPEVFIQLKTKLIPGKLVVTHEDMNLGYVDFTSAINTGTQIEKYVSLYNEGPGPIRILGGTAEPDDADEAYELFIGKPGEDLEPLEKNLVKSIQASKSMDVMIRYTALTNEGADRDLKIRYENPYESAVLVPMLGGAPKPELVVYPSQQQVAASYIQFHAESEPVDRTLVFANEGMAPLTISAVELVEPPGYIGAGINFEVVGLPALPLTVQPLDLLPLTIRFLAEGEAVINHTNLEITYTDATASEAVWLVAMAGYTQPDLGIVLPYADPGTGADYADAEVGKEVLLNGMESLPGDVHISNNGYTWYLVKKPVASAVKVNTTTGPTISFIPDQAGLYQVALIAQSDSVATGAGSKYGEVDFVNLWSPEALLEITVNPSSSP